MTVQALSIRKLTPEVLPAAHALIESSFRGKEAEKGWCSEAEFFTSPRITPEGMLEKFNNPNTTFLAGYDANGTLVTCCEILRKEGGIGYFGLFAVDPSKQGGGIGSYVLHEAERFACTELGCKTMEMQVIDRRDTLIAYYLRRGYVQSKETRPFPYELFGEGTILRDDLRFVVLEKELVATKGTKYIASYQV